MPTLNIEGRRVKVSDDFMALSPEDQQKTVEEIAQSLGISAQKTDSGEVPENRPENRPEITDGGNNFVGGALEAGHVANEGFIEGIPILGPAIEGATDFVGSNIASMITGRPAEEMRTEAKARQAARHERHPVASMGGSVAGEVLPWMVAGATPLGAKALGIEATKRLPTWLGGSFLPRMAAGGATTAAVGAADTAARGGDLNEIMTSAQHAGLTGMLLPPLGDITGAVARGVLKQFRPTPKTAADQVNKAMQADRKAGQGLTQADEAAALRNDQPLVNIDRGGENTRALARAAANSNPTARQTFDNFARDRFVSQGDRAQSFLDRIMGGNTDDVVLQDTLREMARRANKPAYDAAYMSPQAQALFTRELQDLVQAPEVARAIRDATSRGQTRAVAEGVQAVKNPFVQGADGSLKLRQQPDGSIAYPNLQFWDQVKRNLDSQIGTAQRAGDKPLVADLVAVKKRLTAELDRAVPAYAKARQGAAQFFEAEDALEAGKKFVTLNKDIGQAEKALSAMSEPQKRAFAVGYASRLREMIRTTPDNQELMRKIFGNEALRAKHKLALGPQRFREFEQFAKIERQIDQARNMLGNSTTARQLMELGVIGGTGVGSGVLSGDFGTGVNTGLMMTFLIKGGRAYGNYRNEKVLQEVAEILVSPDPKKVEAAAKLAATSPAHQKAWDAIGQFLNALPRAAATGAGAQAVNQ